MKKAYIYDNFIQDSEMVIVSRNKSTIAAARKGNVTPSLRKALRTALNEEVVLVLK